MVLILTLSWLAWLPLARSNVEEAKADRGRRFLQAVYLGCSELALGRLSQDSNQCTVHRRVPSLLLSVLCWRLENFKVQKPKGGKRGAQCLAFQNYYVANCVSLPSPYGSEIYKRVTPSERYPKVMHRLCIEQISLGSSLDHGSGFSAPRHSTRLQLGTFNRIQVQGEAKGIVVKLLR